MTIDEVDRARAQEYSLLSTLLARSPDAPLLGRLADLRGDSSPLGLGHTALAKAAARTDAEITATPVWTNIQPYLNSGGTNRIPVCPADMSQTFATSYRMLDLNTVPTCRIDPAEHFLQ